MADIFISYKRADRPRVEPLAKALEEQGWSVWWDTRIRGGQSFDRVIEKALSKARCVVVIWSHKSVDSDWVRAEAADGLKRKILVPVTIEQGVKLPLQFRYIHSDELIDWDSKKPSTDFNKLLSDIKEIIGTASIATEPAKNKKTPGAKAPPKEFPNSTGMKFVLIPAGKFVMGDEKEGIANAQPQHEVTISQPFYLQTTQITQGQWKGVMNNNPSVFKNCVDDCPVENVRWGDAQRFIAKLYEMEKSVRYRLPTETEWEYACRAGTTTGFFFGDDAGELGEYAWYSANSGNKTHRVRQKKPNAWGLYDMHGNVWEWVEDDWHGNYEDATSDEGAWIDKSSAAARVFRGGGWGNVARYCRSAFRDYDSPDNRTFALGFRLARSVALDP